MRVLQLLADKPFEGDERGLLILGLVLVIAFVIAWLVQR